MNEAIRTNKPLCEAVAKATRMAVRENTDIAVWQHPDHPEKTHVCFASRCHVEMSRGDLDAYVMRGIAHPDSWEHNY